MSLFIIFFWSFLLLFVIPERDVLPSEAYSFPRETQQGKGSPALFPAKQ